MNFFKPFENTYTIETQRRSTSELVMSFINLAFVSALVIYQVTEQVNGTPSGDSVTETKSNQESATYTLVLVRHGESTANVAEISTGWMDVELTDRGRQQAERAGIALKNGGYIFDVAFTSCLKRAKETLKIILNLLGQAQSIPIFETWHFNERHWGAFTGLTGPDLLKLYTAQEVDAYRANTPPPLEKGHYLYEEIVNSPLYRDIPDKNDIPCTESLLSMKERIVSYWEKDAKQQIEAGQKVLIAGHRMQMKGFIMHLESMTKEDADKINLPNAVPLVYTLDKNFKPITHKFLGDPETIAMAEARTVVLRRRREDGRERI